MESEHHIFGPDFVTDRQRNEANKKAEEDAAAAAGSKPTQPIEVKPPLPKPPFKASVPVGKPTATPSAPVGGPKKF